MYARLSILQGKPGETDKAIDAVNSEIVPKINDFKGCKGFYYLVDRKSGKSIGITLWDSKQSLDESEHAADDNRTSTAKKSGDEIVAVERYEVAISKLN